MKKFALIGVGGYIAPKHLKAIKDTGNTLVAALDRHDSVGVIDSYFPDANFFTEFERFDRHLEKLRRKNGHAVDYVTICSPNYLHDAHVRFGLRIGADVICEKPLVINPWNIDPLIAIASETGREVNTILQLRLHPAIAALKEKIDRAPSGTIHEVDLTYITSRGNWYTNSWKGDISKSGGVATNIGIHFFDMLTWIFGPAKQNIVHLRQPRKAGGFLKLEKANVKWFLSLDQNDLPFEPAPDKPKIYRSVSIDGKEIEFTGGFTYLHTESYKNILAGKGFGMDQVKPSVEIVSHIRNAEVVAIKGDCHPFVTKLK